MCSYIFRIEYFHYFQLKGKKEKEIDVKCSTLITSFDIRFASKVGYKGHQSFLGDGDWRVTGAIASL